MQHWAVQAKVPGDAPVQPSPPSNSTVLNPQRRGSEGSAVLQKKRALSAKICPVLDTRENHSLPVGGKKLGGLGSQLKTKTPPARLLQGRHWAQADQRGSSAARSRTAVAGHGQENVYLEGVRTSTGVWLFMARKLTGKGLLAFLLCHFIPRPRPSWQRCLLSMTAREMGVEVFSLASRTGTRDREVVTVVHVRGG